MGHVGGLPRHDHSYRLGNAPEDVVRRMRELRSAYELREKWSYNNQVRPLCGVLDLAARRVLTVLLHSSTCSGRT